MKFFLIGICCMLIFTTCKKTKGDLSGTSYIRGRLFLTDTLTQQTKNKPLGKRKIQIKYAATIDTLNYLFSTTTDEEGYFIFKNIEEGTPYHIYYEETIDGVLYTAERNSYPPNDTLAIIAQLSSVKQNGIHLTVMDAGNGFIKDVPICIFSSDSLGFKANTCDGSNYNITSSATGQAFKLAIPQGTYYVLGKAKVGGQAIDVKRIVTVADQIVYDTLRFQLPPANNGILITTTDSAGAVIPNVNICIFTSKLLFQQEACGNSNYQLQTGPDGKIGQYSLSPGQYFILATLKVGNDTWQAKETVSLDTSIQKLVLMLRKK